MIRLFAIAIFVSLAGVTLASDHVQMQSADGHLRREIYGAPSPVPGYCYWDSPGDALTFHATNDDGYGNMDCLEPWLVHCDGDSLVFRGQWPFLDHEYLIGSGYYVDLSCSVTLDAEMQLTASRSVTGVLVANLHTLVVEFADGSDLVLLDVDSGQDHAFILLPPGTYQLHMHIEAYKHTTYGYPIEPYEGEVVARWSDPDPVAVQPVTWSSLKALYRR